MKTLAACRAGALKVPVSQRGAEQQHRRLVRQYMRAYSGGGMFGYDAHTLAINGPETFRRLKWLEQNISTLPP